MRTTLWSFTSDMGDNSMRTSIHTTARAAYVAFLTAWTGGGGEDPVAAELLDMAIDSGKYGALDKYHHETERNEQAGDFRVESQEVEIELPPVIQGKPIPGRTDGAIAAVVISAADPCGVVMDENPANRAGQFNYGLTLERATQYLAKHATPLQSRAA